MPVYWSDELRENEKPNRPPFRLSGPNKRMQCIECKSIWDSHEEGPYIEVCPRCGHRTGVTKK